MKSMKGLMPKYNSLPVSPEAQEYPYGLRLCLSHEVLEALGISELPEVGSKLKLSAVVEVCKTEKTESKEYGEKKYMDLQIVEMELGKGKKEDVEPEKIYGAPNKPSGNQRM